MKKLFVVYTEIWNNMETENWYYGQYSSEHQANEVALELGNGNGVYHKICTADEVHKLNIKNLPASLL